MLNSIFQNMEEGEGLLAVSFLIVTVADGYDADPLGCRGQLHGVGDHLRCRSRTTLLPLVGP